MTPTPPHSPSRATEVRDTIIGFIAVGAPWIIAAFIWRPVFWLVVVFGGGGLALFLIGWIYGLVSNRAR